MDRLRKRIGLKSLVIYLKPFSTTLFFFYFILNSSISNQSLHCFLFLATTSSAALFAASKASRYFLSYSSLSLISL